MEGGGDNLRAKKADCGVCGFRRAGLDRLAGVARGSAPAPLSKKILYLMGIRYLLLFPRWSKNRFSLGSRLKGPRIVD